MKTKILSLVIACILMFGSVSVNASQNEADTEISYKAQLLADLGLLPDFLKSELGSKKQIQRDEFAALVSRLASFADDDSGIAQSIYSDVPASGEYAPAIHAVSQYGYMSGDGNGKFQPDEKVSYTQVIKVFLSMLGYDDYAAIKGGYPSGYLIVANELKINRGIDIKNDKIYIPQIVELAYNMLHTEIMETVGIVDGEAVVSNKTGKSFLEAYHKIRLVSGTVKAVNTLMSVEMPALSQNEIIIDGYLWQLAFSDDYTPYFGHMVDAYANADNKILAITGGEYGSETVSVELRNVIASGNYIEYTDGDEEVTVRISSNTDVIYNGKPQYIEDWSIVLASDGKIDFIYSDDDKAVDIISVTVADNYVIKTIDWRQEIIYDKYSSKSFSVKDLTDYTIIDSFGQKMTFSELGTFDVLSIVQSTDKEITTIYYSNREAEGSIAGMNTSDDEYIIGNNAYRLAKSYAAGKEKIDMKSQGIFLIDYFGNIAGFKEYSDSFKFGYVLGIKLTEGLEKSASIKIFGQDGIAHHFDFNEKIYLDGESKDYVDAIKLLKSRYNDKGFLIRYYLTNQKVKSIDTLEGAGNSAEDGLRSVFQGYDDNGNGVTSLMFNGYQNNLGSKVAITPATTIFFIPTDGSLNEDNYFVAGRSYFKNWEGYYINAYTDSADNYISPVLVMYGGGGSTTITYTTPYVIVDSVSKCIAESGDEAYKINGFARDPYQKGKNITVLLEDVELVDNLTSVSDSSKKHILGVGDVIKIGYDSLGKPVDLELYYEYDANSIVSETVIATDLLKEERTMRVSVYSIKDSIAWLTQQPLNTSGITLGLNDVEVVNIDKYDIFYVENKGNKAQLVQTTSASVMDYLNHGEAYSNVIICAAYNSPGIMIIR